VAFSELTIPPRKALFIVLSKNKSILQPQQHFPCWAVV
jgi:hypothetical protein